MRRLEESLIEESNSSDDRNREHGSETESLLRNYEDIQGYRSISIELSTNTQIKTNRVLTTFTGVWVPVTLSMFSSLLFLRMGFVVGQAGLLETLLHFAMAYFLLTMTALAISAISTNGAIEGGGAYFMISRALGPEFGGAMGLLFFLAQIFSCALYIAGFVEGFTQAFPEVPQDSRWWSYLYATAVCVVCLIICLIGGQMFARTSLFILAIVIVCSISVVVSFFAVKEQAVDIPCTVNEYICEKRNISGDGNTTTFVEHYTGFKLRTLKDNLYSRYQVDYDTLTTMTFASVFAILFSSVTGIMNGANMSGDLKNPSKSIPRGTLGGMAFTFVVYVIMALGTASTCTRGLLLHYYNYLQVINLWKWFVVIGVFSTTLSAALGNMIGASRILEAVAKDDIFWKLLKPATRTVKGNPIVAVLISFILVQAVLLIGSLNAIAPMTTVIFLLSYAGVNLACMALDVASAPNFRPTFRYFSSYTCVIGMLGCLAMTFLINPIYASVGLAVLLLLIILLHLRSLPTDWGSISQAIIFHQVRKYLLLLDPRKNHVKFWRPQMLLLVANPRCAPQRIEFINDLKKSGLFVIGHVKLARLDSLHSDPVQREFSAWLGLVDLLKVKAFVEVTTAPSIQEGAQHLARISGIGGMKPNTVCLGFYDEAPQEDYLLGRRRKRARSFFQSPEDESDEARMFRVFDQVRDEDESRKFSLDDYVSTLNDMLKMQKNICVLRHFEHFKREDVMKSKQYHHIDIWPFNMFNPQSICKYDTCTLFLLQLGCVLHMVHDWKKRSKLRVFLPVRQDDEDVAGYERKLYTLLMRLRIDAVVIRVYWDDALSLLEDHGAPAEADMMSTSQEVFNQKPSAYLSAVNGLIKSRATQTAAVFLYLPRPPKVREVYSHYINQLDILTQDLPPTILVHGLNTVTSTTL